MRLNVHELNGIFRWHIKFIIAMLINFAIIVYQSFINFAITNLMNHTIFVIISVQKAVYDSGCAFFKLKGIAG